MTADQQYQEPLDASEYSFLLNKATKERKSYLRIYLVLLLLSFIFPFITSWYRLTDEGSICFSKSKFILSSGILFSISTIAIFVTYRYFLHKLQLDLKANTKTITGHKIEKKVFVASNNTHHFYIDSAIKISIEVSADDFNKYSIGDEVYIEYATYSKQYFGYF